MDEYKRSAPRCHAVSKTLTRIHQADTCAVWMIRDLLSHKLFTLLSTHLLTDASLNARNALLLTENQLIFNLQIVRRERDCYFNPRRRWNLVYIGFVLADNQRADRRSALVWEWWSVQKGVSSLQRRHTNISRLLIWDMLMLFCL